MTTAISERTDGYERFFGLREAPFSLAPNPRFLFESVCHSMAFAQVAYAIERRELLVVVTGDIGTGKTLLCRTVLQRLERKTFVSVIGDPLIECDELLKILLQDFGLISKDRNRLGGPSRAELVQTLRDFLRSLVPIQAHAVVIVDEAQHLRPEVLEQIRLLSNIDDERGTLLQIILVGQTDLDSLLSRPELRQLRQRVSRRVQLSPLDHGEVQAYVAHRLALARDPQASDRASSASNPNRLPAESIDQPGKAVFTPEAIHAVATLSGGLPRVINLLCDRSLEAAYEAQVRTVGRALVEQSARALDLAGAPPLLIPSVVLPPVPPSVPILPAPQIEKQGERPVLPSSPVVDSSAGTGLPNFFDEKIQPVSHESPQPRRVRYLAVAIAAAIAVALLWWGLRVAAPAAVQVRPPSAGAPVESAAPGAASDRAPGSPGASVPGGAATADTAPREAARSSATATTDERVEIVVASFRTDARASAAAAAVEAAGLPTRRRVADGWQQVICGPFATRAEAEDAQRRLERAGLTGTQIVPAIR